MADNSHVPLAFEPRKLRSRVVYRKLRNHYFTASEKTWLCSSLTDAYTSRKHRDIKVKTVCNRHSLPFTVLQEWMVVHSLNHEQFPGLMCARYVLSWCSWHSSASCIRCGRQKGGWDRRSLCRSMVTVCCNARSVYFESTDSGGPFRQSQYQQIVVVLLWHVCHHHSCS